MDTAEILKNDETVVTGKEGYDSGSIGLFGGTVNNAYDLYLVKIPSGDFRLIIFMKLQFFFKKSKDNDKWTDSEKNRFVGNWIRNIRERWGNDRVIRNLEEGKRILLDVRFKTRIGGWMRDHWEITVTKIPDGAFKQSSVNPLTGNVKLDSEDLDYAFKGNGMRQRGAVHEFGHMLGLDDEYLVESKYAKEYDSVMNSGETIKARHDSVYMKWLDNVLNEKGIK